MESPKPSVGPSSSPLLSLSAFVHQHCARLGADLSTRLDEAKRFGSKLAASFPVPLPSAGSRFQPSHSSLPFASVSQKPGPGSALSSDRIAKTLLGTSVYTVSNANNEFVLISDPNSAKSIGLLCFRKEDAEAFRAQVRSRRREVKGEVKVVPITLDQVYMLNVEGIAFRFLPDPVQLKNALELKAKSTTSGFDGVPVFQSDLLVVKKRNRRYLPIFFRKEDIEKELLTVSRASRGGSGVSQHIMVGSLEDVLTKMQKSGKNSGWEDLVFIPPGKSHSQHIQDIMKP
ncbi:protein TIC 22, chloroplastic [Ipomoea triloba]|uniref:protein TIC 22, chloroplastic n=1 Tax=Ipomoea triloba TaxID=35885 RepID=UPI00125D8EC4|nr:protein TIC 22, chloroplastic [Ipomoea triloba]